MSDSALPTPAPAAFGEPLPVAASPEVFAYLARRRSASAMTLAEPGPSDEQIRSILNVAARAPDHGKLEPWRFIVLRGEAKARFAERLAKIAHGRPDGEGLARKLGKLTAPPCSVVVVSRLVGPKIPAWEQRLSAGAVCALLLVAAGAAGFGANWITDWYAYDEEALALLGLQEDERVAGYIHLGTAAEAPLERARPDVAAITQWPEA